MEPVPEVVKTAIAIRNFYGYGAELKRWVESLSEADKAAIRRFQNGPSQEEVEQAQKLFKDILEGKITSTA